MNEMRITHIDTHLSWRGGQRQVLELIRGLNGQGHINTLICKTGSEISRRAGECGIHVVHIPMRGEWDIASVLKIRSFIKKGRIHITHVHTSHAHFLAVMALWKLDTCKLIVARRVDFHVHNYLSRKFKYGSRVDKIITVSDAVKRILIEDGIDPDILVTIRSGFIVEEFADNKNNINLRAKLGLSENTVVIASVAALAPHKDHYVLLKAAYYVVQKHPETVFLLAGEGELQEKIKKDIHSLGLDKSVLLLGFIEEIGSVYDAADIFALSSREEALCSSLLDAMYFKLPVVATSAGGVPELIQDNVNGFIVPVGDYDSFADRLNRLIENAETRKKMGSRSSAILNNNTIKHTIDKTIEVYQDVLNVNN